MATNEERILLCEKDIAYLKNNNEKIWHQVSNHLPTMIKEFDSKNEVSHKDIYDKLERNAKENREMTNKIIWYIAIGLMATTAVTVFTQLFLRSLT